MDYKIHIKKKKRTKKSSNLTFNSKIAVIKEFDQEKYFGRIWLGETNNIIPEEYENCNSEIFSKNDNDFMKLFFDSTIVLVKITTDIQFLKDLFSTKVFNFLFEVSDGELYANLYFNQFPLTKFTKKIGNVLRIAFNIVYNVMSEEMDMQKIGILSNTEEINQLYKNIKQIQNDTIKLPEIEIEHPALIPQLREYQKDAVRWMIFREGEKEDKEILHPMYQEVHLHSGKLVYFDRFTGDIQEEKPLVQNTWTGGILADEMGLGKTVEVLALMLLNPKQELNLNDSLNRSAEKRKSCDELEAPIYGTPTIEQPQKKIKIKHKPQKETAESSNKYKEIEEPPKSTKNKTANRIALEKWYESTLKCYAANNVAKREERRVQCICGDDSENNTVPCVDCNKRQHMKCMGYKEKYGEYRCPQCWKNQPVMESRATLIVTPTSIENQWCTEICKHIGAGIKILKYHGGKNSPVYPTKLCDYDIVITTYAILQNEFKLSETNEYHTSMLRRIPKYSTPGCPILLIKFWRLCIDEAQTVESPEMQVSSMTKKIQAHHRWAVTGTPISRNLCDIYGLINYLQFYPYDEKETWNHLFYENYIKGNNTEISTFLSKIMWRTSKNDVLNQINIPKQEINVIHLEFSAVEKFFYDREHELSKTDFFSKLSKFDINLPLKSLDKGSIKNLLNPLLSLRQACAHHNAVKGKYLVTRKSVKSMDDLLDALIAKNITDCEELARVIVSSLNGLAGINLLNKQDNEAADKYREVLSFSKNFEGKSQNNKSITFSIDKLLLIHTLYNLDDILRQNPNIGRSIDEDNLKEKWVTLQNEYTKRFHDQTWLAITECRNYTLDIEKKQNAFLLTPGEWYIKALNWIIATNYVEEFNTKVMSILNTQNITVNESHDFSNKNNFLKSVGIWDDEISGLRFDTINQINDLYSIDGENDGDKYKISMKSDLVVKAMNCHLRPSKKKKGKVEKCPVCLVEVQLKSYECRLFDMKTKNTEEDDIALKGNWKASKEEYVLKVLHSLCVQKNFDQEVINDGKSHMKIIDVMKKEFKELRKLWTLIDQLTCAEDELEMCKIRLKLKEDFETEETQSDNRKILKQLSNDIKNVYDNINLLSAHELHYQQTYLENDIDVNKRKLEKCLGTHSYLQTLRKNDAPPDPCPICKTALDKQWNVLSCGHAFCLECVQVLIGQSMSKFIMCSVCREKHNINNILFVQNDKSQVMETTPIKGNCSTKVYKIVELVKQFLEEDKDVKVLIFTNFQVLLNILKTVFQLNDISSEILSVQTLQKVLNKFQDETKGVTVLLLPISLGSKGLNLIEATKIIFVEPVTNPADEFQAIGRVHRIGQTRETHVYKFIMKNTIEEKIHNAISNNKQKWDTNKVTLNEFRLLFENSEDTE